MPGPHLAVWLNLPFSWVSGKPMDSFPYITFLDVLGYSWIHTIAVPCCMPIATGPPTFPLHYPSYHQPPQFWTRQPWWTHIAGLPSATPIYPLPLPPPLGCTFYWTWTSYTEVGLERFLHYGPPTDTFCLKAADCFPVDWTGLPAPVAHDHPFPPLQTHTGSFPCLD